jgi:C4-dicarboxylate-specific signal transduction histidine kinase
MAEGGARDLGTRLAAAAVAGALLVLVVFVAGRLAHDAALARLQELGSVRLAQYATILGHELGRVDHLPSVIALQPEVRGFLRRPADPALKDQVNRYLETINRQAGASVIYLLDPRGRTLAASNWQEPDSFVGVNLAYRPYFQQALCCDAGRFYGIGTTSDKPGYYYARAIRNEGQILGVAVVKVTLDLLEEPFPVPPQAIVVDADGVIILASEPGWTYRTLGPLPSSTRERYRATRRFEGVGLEPLDWQVEQELEAGERIVSVPGAETSARERLLAQDRGLIGSDWRVVVLSDLDNVVLLTRSAQAISGLAVALLILLALYLRQRHRTMRLSLAVRAALERANAELEQKVAARTRDLLETNNELQEEVAERVRAEQALRETQDELIHAGKLAVLGQMAAGITHEINQPLAALRTLSDNAATLLRRGMTEDVQGNLAMIADIVERMASMINQLKGFARKTGSRPEPVSVARCVARARMLLEQRIRTEGVRVIERVSDKLVAAGESARLEQVLVNLLGNALDAVTSRSDKEIRIEADETDGRVMIAVRDNGPGIAEEALPRLFEPFFTTKAIGAGLGLGLAISQGVVRDFGGVLRARNRPEGGAEFTIELPAAVQAREAAHA